MNKRFAVTLAGSTLAAIFSGTAILSEPAVNVALSRYPGATITRNQNVDAAHLARGWLSWHAAYETTEPLETVALWYASQLPKAETHEVGQCEVLRQSQAWWHMVRARTVQLCARRPGTAILVDESVSLGP